MIGQLNDIEMNNVLSSRLVGRLAFTERKKPRMLLVSYTYDGKFIYAQTNVDRILKTSRKSRDVCFQVDMITSMRNWQSVIVLGKAEPIESAGANETGNVYFDQESIRNPMERRTNEKSEERGVIFRIKIMEVTGRYEKE
jgi:uncharacterized protein